MSTYRVWICDPIYEGNTRKGGGQIRSMGLLAPVVGLLTSWFNPIAKSAGFTGGAQVIFPRYQAHVAAHELLCYVMPNGLSVVKNKPGLTSGFPNPNAVPNQGATDPNPPNASEIWLKPGVNNANAIASLIFHELMHNKLRQGSRLHWTFHTPPLFPCQMSCAHMRPPTSGPKPHEAAGMTRVLGDPVQQWTGGQAIMFGARAAKIAGDPLWDAALKP